MSETQFQDSDKFGISVDTGKNHFGQDWVRFEICGGKNNLPDPEEWIPDGAIYGSNYSDYNSKGTLIINQLRPVDTERSNKDELMAFLANMPKSEIYLGLKGSYDYGTDLERDELRMFLTVAWLGKTVIGDDLEQKDLGERPFTSVWCDRMYVKEGINVAAQLSGIHAVQFRIDYLKTISKTLEPLVGVDDSVSEADIDYEGVVTVFGRSLKDRLAQINV